MGNEEFSMRGDFFVFVFGVLRKCFIWFTFARL